MLSPAALCALTRTVLQPSPETPALLLSPDLELLFNLLINLLCLPSLNVSYGKHNQHLLINLQLTIARTVIPIFLPTGTTGSETLDLVGMDKNELKVTNSNLSTNSATRVNQVYQCAMQIWTTNCCDPVRTERSHGIDDSEVQSVLKLQADKIHNLLPTSNEISKEVSRLTLDTVKRQNSENQIRRLIIVYTLLALNFKSFEQVGFSTLNYKLFTVKEEKEQVTSSHNNLNI